MILYFLLYGILVAREVLSIKLIFRIERKPPGRLGLAPILSKIVFQEKVYGAFFLVVFFRS